MGDEGDFDIYGDDNFGGVDQVSNATVRVSRLTFFGHYVHSFDILFILLNSTPTFGSTMISLMRSWGTTTIADPRRGDVTTTIMVIMEVETMTYLMTLGISIR